MKAQFYLAANADKKNEHVIRLFINSKGIQIQTSTGYKVQAKDWDKQTARIKKGTITASGMKADYINASLSEIQGHFGVMDDNRKVFTREEIYDEIGKMLNRTKKKKKDKDTAPLLSNLILRFITDSSANGRWTMATVKKFRTIRKHIEEIQPGVRTTDVNLQFMEAYVRYFIQKGFINTTINKYIKFLRTFLRWCTEKGYPMDPTWKKYKSVLRHNDRTIIFLEWDELMKIYHLPLPPEKAYLDRVRDVFCFTCFTGLRWSDVAALQRSDCYEDHIRVITQKTHHNTKIELNKYSKAILNKYRDSLLTGDAALPVISTQKMNDYLHELGQLAGLNTPIKQVYYCGAERREVTSPKWQWLTTHCGRRTFICNALALGIAPNVIMQWTGHSDYKAMLPYIAIADSTRVQAMDKFNI